MTSGQYSIFESCEPPEVLASAGQRPQTTPDGEPVRWPVAFHFLDRVQRKHSEDEPAELFRQRLERVFGKAAISHDGALWFEFGGRWTFCEAREPSDVAERARGMIDIYRAVL